MAETDLDPFDDLDLERRNALADAEIVEAEAIAPIEAPSSATAARSTL